MLILCIANAVPKPPIQYISRPKWRTGALNISIDLKYIKIMSN